MWYGPAGEVSRKVRAVMARTRREARQGTHLLAPWEEVPTDTPGQTVYTAQCYQCRGYARVVVTEGAPGTRRTIQAEHHGTDRYYQHPWLSG